MAIHFLKKGISPEDKEAVAKACIDADVSIVYENGVQQVYLNGENITGHASYRRSWKYGVKNVGYPGG